VHRHGCRPVGVCFGLCAFRCNVFARPVAAGEAGAAEGPTHVVLVRRAVAGRPCNKCRVSAGGRGESTINLPCRPLAAAVGPTPRPRVVGPAAVAAAGSVAHCMRVPPAVPSVASLCRLCCAVAIAGVPVFVLRRAVV
jgi:hypothetical protein